MGDSRSVLGPTLGKFHAWRDRGSNLTEGIRTSGQFGMLAAGVAKGAGFTDSAWAITIGLTLAVGVEALKLVLGFWEYKYRVIHRQQEMVAEANPIQMRQVDALEALVAQHEEYIQLRTGNLSQDLYGRITVKEMR